MRTLLLAASAACASSVAAQSITTGFAGTLTTTNFVSGSGGYFSVTALDPQGITITHIDTHLAAGTVLVGFLYRPGEYQGFEQDIGAWLHLGERSITAWGAGTGTPTWTGSLYIPSGRTFSFRQVQMTGTTRLDTEQEMQGAAVITTSHAQLNRGTANTNGYIYSSLASPRGWNGTIYYVPGGSATVGACCLLDGACALLRTDECRLEGGVFHGGGVQCGGVVCAQPALGACCLPAGGCLLRSAPECEASGGFFCGSGTQCTSHCGSLSTPFQGTETSGSAMFNGHFFTATAGSQDVLIQALDINSAAGAGTPITLKVHTRPDTWEGFATDPDAWTVHAELPAVSAGANQPTRVRFPLGRELRIPANQTVAIRLGVSSFWFRRAVAYVPLVEDDHLRMNFGAIQSTPWSSSTLFANRTWSGTVYYALPSSGPPPCYPNCDGSTASPILNVADFGCFLSRFAAGDPYANCDNSTASPILNVADFGCFLSKFAAGCR